LSFRWLGYFLKSSTLKVVTGAGAELGIGFRCAVLLASLGASVVITSTSDRIYKRAEELVSFGRECAAIVAEDLSAEDACISVAEFALTKYGRIDILVNNAGMISMSSPSTAGEVGCESGDALSLSLLGWQRSLRRNLDTCFLMTKACLKVMSKSGFGRIINISSTTGPVNATTGDVAYASAKAAMVGFTRACALDVAGSGITVNAIAPGWICTSSQTKFEADQGRVTPMGRSGTADEVASAIGFLASPGASYITGQLLTVDGGNSVDEARKL
jgi:3-oxoacyl-[acyl-carrier protein] reductase